MDRDRLTVTQIAARLGISSSTWRSYVARGNAPRPDGQYDARTPWWLPETVEAWRMGRTRRPGRPHKSVA